MKRIIHFLFNKEHLARTFWGVILALIFFILGIWYNSQKAPSKVEVINLTFYKDTLYIALDEEFQTGLSHINREVDDLRRLYVELIEKPREQTGKTEKNELDRMASPIPISPIPRYTDLYISRVQGTPVLAEIYYPRFKMPAIVKGYVVRRLSTLAKVEINTQTLTQNSELNIIFELLDESTYKEISPIILTILRRESENSYTQIIDQKYKIKKGKNLIRLITDFGKGEYILRIGFYFLNNINTQYPEFYHSDFKISVS